jgi:hypothetical protein
MMSAIAASGKTEHHALLIRMKEGEYLVPKDNLMQLAEFAKTFKAEIHRVVVSDFSGVLDLSALPRAICDARYKLDSKYVDLGLVAALSEKPIEHKVSAPRPEIMMTREMIRARAESIRKHIRDELLQGKMVTLNQLCEEFDEEISRTAMSNHLSRVRAALEVEGTKVARVGAGKYQVNIWGGDILPPRRRYSTLLDDFAAAPAWTGSYQDLVGYAAPAADVVAVEANANVAGAEIVYQNLAN